MPDHFTEVTSKGWLSRIGDSIKGILFGGFLFLASFVLLYWNEGRENLAQTAATSVEVSATEKSELPNKSFISTTGTITSPETIGDDYLQPGKYIAVKRTVEMYAWEERTETTSDTNMGGSETTTTEYKYDTIWTNSPESSSNFKHPEGHENPPKSISDQINRVNEATIGRYQIDTHKVTMPKYAKINLTDENVILPEKETPTTVSEDTSPPGEASEETSNEHVNQKPLQRINNQYLFQGQGTLQNPEIGDIRISYSVVWSDREMTIFGTLNGEKIETYLTPENNKLYRMFYGSREEAISTLQTEHTIITWGLRALGFFLMWIGLSLIIAPINVLFDVLPIAGKVSRAVTGGITFVIALVLSSVTIVVSMIVHNVWAVLISVIAGGIIMIFWAQRKARKNTSSIKQEEQSFKSAKDKRDHPEKYQPSPRIIQLANFIKPQIGKKNPAEIESTLVNSGYTKKEIDEALAYIAKNK